MRFLSRTIFSLLPLAALFTGTAQAQTGKTIRLAVIGGSVANAGFPARLGVRLTADSVISYAFGGGTVLKSGDSSYWTSGKLAQVFAYQPDIVVIHLGGNDSKPVNWNDSANFEKDYKALIDTLGTLPSQPRIIVAYPTPVWKDETAPQSPQLLRGSVIQNSIVPLVRKIAKDKGADTVNLHAPLLARQTLFTDSINPTTAGNDTLGRRVFLGLVEQSIRIMCVGNSITEATGNTVKQRYPQRLNMLLGKRYWVWNGGKTGWWMQRAQLPGASGSYKSYITDKNLMDTLFMMKPHFITIKLGTNDARQNFWNGARFVNDYRFFIDTLYNNMTPKPKFIPLKALPAWKVNGNWPFSNGGANTPALNGINGDIIRDSLRAAIDTIAASRPSQIAVVVDMYTPFVNALGTLVPTSDGVHPNAAGLDTMAQVLYRAMLPIVTSVRPAARPSPKADAPAARALRFTARPAAAPRGMRALDGRSAGSRPAAGVYVKPAMNSTAKKVGNKK